MAVSRHNPKYDFSSATGINNRGQIVGISSISTGFQRAVVWDGGRITDLGTLPGDWRSSATGINNRGQIVGTSGGNGTPGGHGVVWENGQITDLGTLPNMLSSASGINDRGQIVGSSGGHAVLWQPKD